MALWKVQLGKHGEQETAIEHNVVAIGSNELLDISNIDSRESLWKLYRELHSGKTSQHVSSVVAQIWAFRARMQIDDWVVVPLKTQRAFAVGRVASGYEYRTDLGDELKHTRRVKWVSTAVPRSVFDQDLLYSLRAAMTVCQISRNSAESRVEALFFSQERKKTPQKKV